MISYFQAIIIGAVQGITELFPVSSLGHSVIIPPLLGWNIDQNAGYFLVFLVATHLATSIVLFFFFFSDWALIIKGIFRSLIKRNVSDSDTYAKLGWLIVIGTVPAGILGILFENYLQKLFAAPLLVAIFLFFNGIVLLIAEYLRKKKIHLNTLGQEIHSDAEIAKLFWSQAVKVGLAEALALIPGFSRTGTTLGGGLLVGLDHENAARFAFLLATPIIFAAAALKLPELLTPAKNSPIFQILAGAIAAAVGAYFSVKFLTKYFQTKTLKPFAVYCLVVGLLTTIVFLIR